MDQSPEEAEDSPETKEASSAPAAAPSEGEPGNERVINERVRAAPREEVSSADTDDSPQDSGEVSTEPAPDLSTQLSAAELKATALGDEVVCLGEASSVSIDSCGVDAGVRAQD